MADKLMVKYTRMSVNESGDIELTFTAEKSHRQQILEIISDLKSKIAKGKDNFWLTVKEFRKERTKTQNAYAWELIGKLSEVLDLPSVKIYQKYIKEVGVYRDGDIDDKAANALMHAWGLNGLGWFSEKIDFGEYQGFSKIRFYYGSSSYNTKYMARLIDNIVQDCKSVGIQTLTERELALLKDN